MKMQGWAYEARNPAALLDGSSFILHPSLSMSLPGPSFSIPQKSRPTGSAVFIYYSRNGRTKESKK